MISYEKVMELATTIYTAQKLGYLPKKKRLNLQSAQVRSIAKALVEEINNELLRLE